MSATTDRMDFANPLREIQSGSRYFFESEDFARVAGHLPNGPTVKKALNRLVRRNLAVLAMKRPSGWLIVPAEQKHYGAPPVTWWIDDCLKRVEPHYYVALLSAAKHWGSSHYALQTTQVMVSRPRAPMTPGKLRVEFFTKRSLSQTPTVMVTSGVAPWRVSTREATLLDLLRHQTQIGGLESIARIATDLAPAITPQGLHDALEALDQVPVAQRLGYILDRLGLKKLANVVEKWIFARRTSPQPLELQSSTRSTEQILNQRWNILANEQTPALLGELA